MDDNLDKSEDAPPHDESNTDPEIIDPGNTDGETSQAETSQADTSPALSRFLLYTLSLPERTVRSTVAMTAGAAKEMTEFLVPRAFQSSTTYEIVIRNSLNFLTENIGGVQGDSQGDAASDDYMARKAVGNFVDLAGLATLHVSPLWVLAIVSDVAYGSKTYLTELADELKKQGLIDESSTIHHVDDILGAVKDASGQAASLFDTPPLSVDQLKETLQTTREAIGSADYLRILPEAELKQYWDEMRDISTKEDVSLLGVSGALTMHTLGKVETVSRGALTGVKVAGGLLNTHVVGHYVDSLKLMRERGFYETVSEASAPYVEAIWNNFSDEKETLTEEVVTGRAIGKMFKNIAGWFRAKKEQDHDEKTGDATQAEGPPTQM